MKTIRVNLPGRAYDIINRPGILDEAGALCRPVLQGDKAAIITDSHVEPLYAARVARSFHLAGFEPSILEVPAGETSKCPTVLAELWEQLMDIGLTRTDAVVALGGGVVGDLAGFAAATILRGVRFVQIPTTLLAQVDSSVGGKVAVDLQAGKNLAGAFYQPKIVLMDPDTLSTLPDRVFSDGMAEVIKYGCIWDSDLFAQLEQGGSRAAVMADIAPITSACCDIKRQVVEQDELDSGVRMLLNFGHTLGHVYEQAYHYETYTHGEAIAAGMVDAAQLGEALDLTPAGTATRIAALLSQFGLPTRIPVALDAYEKVLTLDKKSTGDDIHFVFLTRLGAATVKRLSKRDLLQHIREVILCR